MKKRILTLMLLFVAATFAAEANPVDLRTAREVAVKFMNANSEVPLRSADDLRLVKTYNISRGDAAFYIFNTPNGFVIVAADDCATPILGYSDEGQFDENDIPVQLQDYLQDYLEQIQHGIENHLEANQATTRQWELVQTAGHLIEQRATTVVEPLIASKWGQGCFYNNCCPLEEYGSCGHAKVGCMATSFAQILHYWGYPAVGIGSHTSSGYPTQTVNFGATFYDWADMPNSLSEASATTQVDAVATLMWHCGVAVNMNYGAYSSGASMHYVVPALVNYFGYSEDLSRVTRNNYSDEEWMTMMKDCLDLGRPVHYFGSGSSGGHAFVCDGYDANDMLHFNWGWYGASNGYYALGALNPENYDFNAAHEAIINIHPKCTSGMTYQVTASVNPSFGGDVYGTDYYDCNDVCILTAVPENGYVFSSWIENGVMVSTEPMYIFTVTGNRNLVANFAEEGSVCNVVIDLYDSFEYGWNGNSLVVDYGNGVIEQFTMSGGSSASYYRQVMSGSRVTLSWIYDPSWFLSVCSFDISYDNGVPIYHGEDLIPEFQYEFTVDCDAAYAPRVISVIADPEEGGAVSGGGAFGYGDICTVIASPNEGYYFANWTANGMVASSDLTYSFVVVEESVLTAHFVTEENIVFVDDSVKALCVANWDTNGDGELSYFEASMVTSLGEVFSYNTGITSFDELQYFISLPSINAYAFSQCTNLTSLIIPDAIASIDDGAFWYCSALTGSLTIPNSVTSIGSSAFEYCRGFTSLTLPNSITSIRYSAFHGCSGLTSLTIPNSVTSIGDYAFCGCSGLTSLTIPNSVTSIGDCAFSSCSGLTSLTIPNSVTSIGDYTFSRCVGLTSLIIPNSVTSIGAGAFIYCRGLAGSLVIPNSVTSIGNSAFEGCYGVKGHLIIGDSVTSIGNYAFRSCSGLASIVVLPQQPPTVGINAFPDDIPIYVPCKPFVDYQSAAGWDAFPDIIGMCGSGTISVVANPVEGGMVSGDGLYANGSICIAIAIPNEGYNFVNWTENGVVVSYDSIYSFIVTGESVLTAHFAMEGNIVFADANVKAICVANWDTNGDGELSYVEAAMVTDLGSVFKGNGNITSFDELQYFTGLSSIGSMAFLFCNGLTSIVLPGSLISIEDNAFVYCCGLNAITIPNSVTSIEDNAFMNCWGLNAITIPNSVVSMAGNPFAYCTGLSQIVVEEGNPVYDSRDNCNAIIKTSINELFVGCKNSTIPDSIISIGYGAFEYCNVTSITIPNSVVSIGERAFYACNLTSLTIPNSMAFIGRLAFGSCFRLSSITVLAVTPPSLDNYTFSNVSKSIPVYVPCGSLEEYQNAGDWGEFTNYMEMCPGTITVVASPAEGGTVTGGGYYEGGAVCTLTATANAGYVFANWTKNGEVVSSDETYHFIVTGDASFEAHFHCVRTHTLTQGVNWFSSDLEITLDDLKESLLTALPETSITIKGKSGSIKYIVRTHSWNGTLDWDITKMYKIDVPNACEITLEGDPIIPADHPITIVNGPNWIGYPLVGSMTVTAAFANFGVVNGDVVKSKSGSTRYWNGSWRPNGLNTLEPGQGYIFNSAATGERTLVFPSGAK